MRQDQLLSFLLFLVDLIVALLWFIRLKVSCPVIRRHSGCHQQSENQQLYLVLLLQCYYSVIKALLPEPQSEMRLKPLKRDVETKTNLQYDNTDGQQLPAKERMPIKKKNLWLKWKKRKRGAGPWGPGVSWEIPFSAVWCYQRGPPIRKSTSASRRPQKESQAAGTTLDIIGLKAIKPNYPAL